MAAKHLFLVCGYGCHETSTWLKYMDEIVLFCNDEQPDALMFSGGFTERVSAPGISEAELMEHYVLPRLKYVLTLRAAYLDDDSYTTPDNIENLAKKISAFGLLDSKTKLTIGCNTSRKWTVRILALRFLRHWPKVKTVDWYMAPVAINILAFFFACLGIVLPVFARRFHDSRVQRAMRT